MSLVKPSVRVHLRYAIASDLYQMLCLFERCMQHPMTRSQLLAMLRERNIMGMVAEQGSMIVGVFIYRLDLDQIHVMNIAVHPDFQRSGIGRQIIEKLIGKLSRNRRYRLTLNCRETNLGACHFYRACGFKALGIRREFYADTGEDAYAFEYRLPNREG